MSTTTISPSLSSSLSAEVPTSSNGSGTSDDSSGLVLAALLVPFVLFAMYITGVMATLCRRQPAARASSGPGVGTKKPQMWDMLVGDKVGGLTHEKWCWGRINPLALDLTPETIYCRPKCFVEEVEDMTGANNYSFDSVNSKPPAPCNGSHRQPGTRHARVTVLISMPSRPSSFPRESCVEDGSQMIAEGLCEYAVGTAKVHQQVE